MTLLSYIYRILWAVRKRLYDTGVLRTERLPCPVICVGNITTGGTGKTPTVIALAKLLSSHEWGQFSSLSRQRSKRERFKICPRIAILSRGYKRRSKAPVLAVSDGNKILSTPQDAGDEPYLIASALKEVPVIVGKDRRRSGRYAIDRFDTELFILDDGYQHIRLHRELNILLIDATNPFGNGHLLPKGVLREPLSALSRADCIIITKANEGDNREYVRHIVRKYNKESPIFHATCQSAAIYPWKGQFSHFLKENMANVSVTGKPLFLFSGIGNPHSFRRTVEDMGGRVCGEMIFPDHHWYSGKDLERISKEARTLSADGIVTTEKDAARLTGMSFPSELRDKVLILRVETVFDKGFEEWIVGMLQRFYR